MRGAFFASVLLGCLSVPLQSHAQRVRVELQLEERGRATLRPIDEEVAPLRRRTRTCAPECSWRLQPGSYSMLVRTQYGERRRETFRIPENAARVRVVQGTGRAGSGMGAIAGGAFSTVLSIPLLWFGAGGVLCELGCNGVRTVPFVGGVFAVTGGLTLIGLGIAAIVRAPTRVEVLPALQREGGSIALSMRW